MPLYTFFTFGKGYSPDKHFSTTIYQKVRDMYNKPNCLEIHKLPYVDLSTEKFNDDYENNIIKPSYKILKRTEEML